MIVVIRLDEKVPISISKKYIVFLIFSRNKNQSCNLFFFVREYEFLYIIINKLVYGVCGNSSQILNPLSEVRITVSKDV
jgi:hypothetical protein